MVKAIVNVLIGFASQRATNFAFLDQVVVSGANFVAGILLARSLGLHEYGCFALAWMLIEFVGSLQFAAVIQPMMNIGPKQAEADAMDYYAAVATQQGLLCLMLAVLVSIGIALAGYALSEPQLSNLAVPLFAAIVAYQLHNFLRRYFFVRDRGMAALCNDGLRFVAQIAAIAALPAIYPQPTALAGIWIVTGACVLSTVQGAFFFGPFRLRRSMLRQIWDRHWQFSKWLLPSAIMFWMTSQAFLVMAGIVLGAAVTGSVKVALSITGILNILLLALDNFAPAQAARAWHEGGRVALCHYVARLARLTALLIAGIVALLIVDPGYLVGLLFGQQYEGSAYLVRWFCAPAVVYGMNTVLVIWAAAMEKTRPIFMSYAIATAFTLMAAYPLTHYGGLAGVALGSLVVEIIRMIVLWIPLRHETNSSAVRRAAVEATQLQAGSIP